MKKLRRKLAPWLLAASTLLSSTACNRPTLQSVISGKIHSFGPRCNTVRNNLLEVFKKDGYQLTEKTPCRNGKGNYIFDLHHPKNGGVRVSDAECFEPGKEYPSKVNVLFLNNGSKVEATCTDITVPKIDGTYN